MCSNGFICKHMEHHVSREVSSRVTVRIEGGVACEGRLVGERNFSFWCKCTMTLKICTQFVNECPMLLLACVFLFIFWGITCDSLALCRIMQEDSIRLYFCQGVIAGLSNIMFKNSGCWMIILMTLVFAMIGVSGMNSETFVCGRPFSGCAIFFCTLPDCQTLLKSHWQMSH